MDETDRLLDVTLEPSQTGALRGAIGNVRQKLVAFAGAHSLDLGGPSLDVRHTLMVNATMAAISVTEMRPKYLRAYGDLSDAETARAVERDCDDLERLLNELKQFCR